MLHSSPARLVSASLDNSASLSDLAVAVVAVTVVDGVALALVTSCVVALAEKSVVFVWATTQHACPSSSSSSSKGNPARGKK